MQALPGHGDARHGTRTTTAQQATRVQTGLAPDGKMASTPVATRFDSPEAQLHAVTEARKLIDAMAADGRASTAMRVGPDSRARIPRRPVVVTGHPGGYGSGVQVRRNPVTDQPLPGRPVDPTGQYPNAMVVFKWNPLLGKFEPLTQYPTDLPPTPP